MTPGIAQVLLSRSRLLIQLRYSERRALLIAAAEQRWLFLREVALSFDEAKKYTLTLETVSAVHRT